MNGSDIESSRELPVRLPEGIDTRKDQQHQQKTQDGLRTL
jgi:hypothetical protein